MEKATKRKVLIVDDHQLFREGLTLMIDREPDLQVCAQAADAKQAISLIESSKPDMVIVDISLGVTNGIDLIKEIKAKHRHLPMLVLSMHDESLYAERALRAGAFGYVMKQEANKKVREAIRRVLDQQIHLSEKMSNVVMSKFAGVQATNTGSPVEKLSHRELEVFQLIGEGHGTRQIAQSMKLSIPTINSFRARIKDKLGLKNASELVHQAIQWVQNRNLKA